MTIAEQIETIRNFVNTNIVPNGNKSIKAEQINVPFNEILNVLKVISSGSISYEFKSDYSIIADVTEGFVSGTNTVTQADWIGWDFIPSRPSFGPLVLGIHFSYDKETGTLTLLNEDDKFGPQENLFIMFQPKKII